MAEGPAHASSRAPTCGGSGSNVIQPPSPTGSFTFSNLFTRSARDVAKHGHAVRELPARAGAAVLDRPAARRRSATARTSRSTSSRTTGGCRDRVTINAGAALHAELPVDRGRTTRPRSSTCETQQLEYLGRDGNRAPRASCTSSTSARAWASSAASPTGRSCATGYGLVWIEMAGITTPFTTPVFPFLQTVSQRTLDNIMPAFTLADGPERGADSADAGRRPRAGRVLPSIATSAPATCSSGTRRCSASSTANISRRGRLRRIEDHARRHPRHQSQSADRRAAGAGRGAARSACRIRSSARFRARRRSAIRRFPWRSC